MKKIAGLLALVVLAFAELVLASAVVTSTAYFPPGTASVTYGSDSFLR